MKTTNLNIMNTTLLHLSIACLLNLQFMLPLRAQVVFIPDEEFQAAIREALESPSGDITSAQMQSLTRLEAGGLSLKPSAHDSSLRISEDWNMPPSWSISICPLIA